jgi:hypothetical protein
MKMAGVIGYRLFSRSPPMRLRRTLVHENGRVYRLSAIGYRLFSR